MSRYIPLIMLTVLTNFISQIMLKKGMGSIPPIELSASGIFGNILNVVLNSWIVLGLLMMVVSMGCHLLVLSKVEISFAYPFLGLSFVLITLWGHFVLGENVSLLRSAGVALICMGVLLVARSA